MSGGDDVGQLRELALFAGAGGGILGGALLGWRTVCAVEIDPYCQRVLLARQRDGVLPMFPIWDDVQTFDGRPWRGLVDVISGGFPCQDISVAGRGAGIDGAKSGMWRHFARIIREVQPRYVFVENSPALVTRGLGRVIGDLAALGYDARWGVLGAADVGAPHQRDRLWIRAEMANPDGVRQPQPQGGEQDERGWAGNSGGEACAVGVAHRARREGHGDSSERRAPALAMSGVAGWWEAEPSVGRVVDRMASRVDRLRAIGNGQVSAVAATAWNLLGEST